MRSTPKCYLRKCVHLIGMLQTDEEEITEVANCLAFPNGIPDEIAYGDNLHKKRVKLQAGKFVYQRRE